jgi:DNA-binding LacI/PurR family transcriptional regulator
MVSQQDVAKYADVSYMTVSRVINNSPNVRPETRARVLEAIEKLSYYPNAAARALNSSKSRNVGILFPRDDYFYVAPFCMELCVEVEKRLKLQGYHLLLSGTMEGISGPKDIAALYRGGSVDGLIFFAPPIGDERISSLAENGLPFVAVYGRSGASEFSFVDADNVKGASLVFHYLFELGHRRIGFVSGNMDEINSKDRFRSYRRELKRMALPFDEGLVFHGDWSIESGYAGFKALMGPRNRPTAIIFSNDQMAIGAIKAAEDLKIKIPDDVSVTGYDDVKYASFTVPSLTTVRQNIATVGDKVAELILDSIEGKGGLRKVIVEPELIIRSSCRSIL